MVRVLHLPGPYLTPGDADGGEVIYAIFTRVKETEDLQCIIIIENRDWGCR